jgi:hypothetical protein
MSSVLFVVFHSLPAGSACGNEKCSVSSTRGGECDPLIGHSCGTGEGVEEKHLFHSRCLAGLFKQRVTSGLSPQCPTCACIVQNGGAIAAMGSIGQPTLAHIGLAAEGIWPDRQVNALIIRDLGGVENIGGSVLEGAIMAALRVNNFAIIRFLKNPNSSLPYAIQKEIVIRVPPEHLDKVTEYIEISDLFLQAVRTGDSRLLDSLLTKNAFPGLSGDEWLGIINAAIRETDLGFVQRLVGAKKLSDKQWIAITNETIQMHNLSVLKLLFERMPADIWGVHQCRFITGAVKCKDPRIVRFLLERALPATLKRMVETDDSEKTLTLLRYPEAARWVESMLMGLFSAQPELAEIPQKMNGILQNIEIDQDVRERFFLSIISRDSLEEKIRVFGLLIDGLFLMEEEAWRLIKKLGVLTSEEQVAYTSLITARWTREGAMQMDNIVLENRERITRRQAAWKEETEALTRREEEAEQRRIQSRVRKGSVTIDATEPGGGVRREKDGALGAEKFDEVKTQNIRERESGIFGQGGGTGKQNARVGWGESIWRVLRCLSLPFRCIGRWICCCLTFR